MCNEDYQDLIHWMDERNHEIELRLQELKDHNQMLHRTNEELKKKLIVQVETRGSKIQTFKSLL